MKLGGMKRNSTQPDASLRLRHEGPTELGREQRFSSNSPRTCLGLLALLCKPFGLCSCYGPGKVVFQDSRVTAWHSDALLAPVNVHGGERVSLRVGKSVYPNVRGGKPFYVTVPELDVVIFVTEETSEKSTLHLCYNATGKHLAIPIGSSAFGNFIGAENLGRKPGGPGTNHIELLDSENIRLVTRSYQWRETLRVNLVTGKAERDETVIYDDSGAIKSRYLDGRRLQ